MKAIKTLLISVVALALVLSNSGLSFAGGGGSRGAISPSSSVWTQVLKVKGTARVVSGNFENLMKAVRNGARVRISSKLSDEQVFSYECDYIQIGNTESGQKFFECDSSPVMAFDGSGILGKFFDYVDETEQGEVDRLEFFDLKFDGLGGDDSEWSSNAVHTIYVKNGARNLLAINQINYEESDILSGSFLKLFQHNLLGGDTKLVFVNDSHQGIEQIHSFPCEQTFIGTTWSEQTFIDCNGTATVAEMGDSMKSPQYHYLVQPDGEESSTYQDLIFEGAGEGRTFLWSQVGKFYFFEQR
ncbi:MAG: hypothetical protein WC873_00550 [Candidatus Gracilibacteria bacterium]